MKSPIYYKTEEEIEIIRENCLLVSKTLALVGSLLKVGVTGQELDAKAEEFILDHGAKPGFKGYGGFPSTLCWSLNEGVVHGIPSSKPVEATDVVSVDCGVFWNNYYGDAAYTFVMPEVSEDVIELCRVTKTSLYKAIDQAVYGKRIGDIGDAVQRYAEKVHNYGVVRELVGHGIGQNLHEGPEVPNFGSRGKGVLLKKGLVIAIEPMVNLGVKEVRQSSDGWTINTKDGKASAHYEHTVAVGAEKADILSDHSIIEDVIKNNAELVEISIKK
jgi:methionyl aminopeptidase